MPPRLRTTIPAPPAPAPIQTGLDGNQPAPIPVVPDIITRLDAAHNVEFNNGDTTTIDVVPDMRFPLASWIFSLSQNVQSSAYTSSPVASPASVLCYTIIMYTALMLHIDASLRLSPSNYAAAVLNDSRLYSFFQILLDLHVPAFASTEFEALRPHFDDLADSLSYFGSLAGASFLHDFGRHIPCTVFALLHNLMAELPANSTYQTLASVFYTSPVIQLTLPGNVPVDVTPGHLFGATITNNVTHRRYTNWLNQRVDHFISTNAIRVVNATATVTRLPFHSFGRIDTETYNPYIYMLGYTGDNLPSLYELVRNLNEFTKTAFPQSKPLRAYTQIGNEAIVRHLVFEHPLPTWHSNSAPTFDPATEDPQGNVALNLFAVGMAPRTPAQYAAEISFLANRPPSGIDGQPAAFTIGIAAQPDPPVDQLLQLVTSTDPPAALAARPSDSARIHRFANATDYLSRCLIFEPSTRSSAHLGAPIIVGLIIELFDVTAIGLPLPDPTASLGVLNSEYILGAYPMDIVRPGTTNTALTSRARRSSIAYRSPQIIMTGNPNQVIIPVFSPGPITPATVPGNTPTSGLSSVLPGATLMPNLRNALDGINVIASALGTLPPAVPNSSRPLWSSYRYYDVRSRKWYMLPSLRHIYGTRSRLFASPHPAERIN